MGRAILLTGEPRCGKTTVIKQIVSMLDCDVGGFYTQEIREGGERVGFRMITLDGQESILAHVSSAGTPRVGKYGVNVSELESVAVKCIQRTINSHKQVVVID